MYQGIINLTRPNLDIPLLKTMFGSKKRPYQTVKKRADRSSAIEVIVQTPDYNLTIFKIHFGKLTVKLYDKGERTLRAEVVVHNVKELKCKHSVKYLSCIIALYFLTLLDILIKATKARVEIHIVYIQWNFVNFQA